MNLTCLHISIFSILLMLVRSQQDTGEKSSYLLVKINANTKEFKKNLLNQTMPFYRNQALSSNKFGQDYPSLPQYCKENCGALCREFHPCAMICEDHCDFDYPPDNENHNFKSQNEQLNNEAGKSKNTKGTRQLKIGKNKLKAGALTKVAVASGSYNYGTGYLYPEVFDLSNPNADCELLPKLEYNLEAAVGSSFIFDNPIVCGSRKDGEKLKAICLELDDPESNWRSIASFNEERERFAMTRSPIHDQYFSIIFVTGGVGDSGQRLTSTEHFAGDGWELSTPLPVEIESHCMIKNKATSVMVIGGIQGSSGNEASTRTFIFDGVTKVWTEGPELKQKRSHHSCAMITKDSWSQTQYKVPIAVGGLGEQSTEVLDDETSEWKSGPTLPREVGNAAMVEDPSGGVVLIGGGVDYKFITIYRLPHGGSDATWETMPQILKLPRSSHAAFLIRDEFAKCK